MKTKKFLLTILLISTITFTINAQTQPPNAGFESWVNIGSFENPDNWSSFNNFYSYGVPEMSFKTTESHSGNALRLISLTATVPPPLGTNTLDTLAGFVFLGSADMNNPGIFYTDRPLLMQAYVKGTIIPGGNAIIMATLRKWNTVTHVRDQVGMAIYNMTSSILNYTQISVPFNYSLSDTPDTLDIKIMAGDVGPGGFIMPGNEFFVDDIYLTFPVGINEDINNLNIVISQSNATNNLTIETPQQSVSSVGGIEIYNLQGQLLKSISAISNITNIDISSFQTGMYIIEVKTDKGITLKKFIKN